MPHKLNVGNGQHWLKWDGFKIDIRGNITVGGLGEDNEIYFKDSEITLYDFWNGYESGYKGIALKNSEDIFFHLDHKPSTGKTVMAMGKPSNYMKMDNGGLLGHIAGEVSVRLFLDAEPGAKIFKLHGSGQLQLPVLASDPTEYLEAGEIANVNNVLRIYNGETWSNV